MSLFTVTTSRPSELVKICCGKKDGLRQVFEVVAKGRLGEADDCDNEVGVRNMIIRIDSEGVKYEADPRHAEMLVQAGSLKLGNAAVTPGVEPEDVDYDQLLEDLLAHELHAGQLDGEMPQPALDHAEKKVYLHDSPFSAPWKVKMILHVSPSSNTVKVVMHGRASSCQDSLP